MKKSKKKKVYQEWWRCLPVVFVACCVLALILRSPVANSVATFLHCTTLLSVLVSFLPPFFSSTHSNNRATL
jgi:hypothetical protein